MPKNALKMHAGFLLLFFVPFVMGELHLIISEYFNGINMQTVNSTVELTAGTDVYLSCSIGGFGTFSKPHLKWGRKTKDFKFRNEEDLKHLAMTNPKVFNELPRDYFYYYYEYESNKVIRRFEPVELNDRGLHFCMSLKYMLFKIVHIKVKEPSFLDAPAKPVPKKCNPNAFRCILSGYCINSHYKCDGKHDCQDGSDEDHIMCNGNPCWGKIRCRDGRCIPRSWCCDKHTDENCNVTIRPTCCPPLQNPYDPMLWYNKNGNTTTVEIGKSSGSKYLFITICVVSALLSFVLFLFIISKICGFETKPRTSGVCSTNCEHSECVLRREFTTDVTCLYRRDVNTINNVDNNNEIADPLILMNEHISDQPPSYSEAIKTTSKTNLDDLINAPPPPYPSTNFIIETEFSNDNNENNRHCDISGDNESSYV